MKKEEVFIGDSLFKEVPTSLNFKGLDFNLKVFTLIKDATQKEIDDFVYKINCEHGTYFNAKDITEHTKTNITHNILFMGDTGPRPFSGYTMLAKNLEIFSHSKPLEGLAWPKGTTFLVIEKTN